MDALTAIANLARTIALTGLAIVIGIFALVATLSVGLREIAKAIKERNEP